MNNDYEIKNAVIESAHFDTERGLSIWVALDYGGCGQGFGGYLLYGPKGWKAHEGSVNYAGHFIWRLFEVAGVNEWAKLPGRTVRVKANHGNVQAIGHIVKDDWFDPKAEFAAMRPEPNSPTATVAADAIERLTAEREDYRQVAERMSRDLSDAATRYGAVEICHEVQRQEWLAQRDAQVREAFDFAFQAGLMAVDKFGEQHTSADEAWAARPSSGTGSGDKEQGKK